MRNVYFVIEDKKEEEVKPTALKVDYNNEFMYEAFKNGWDSLLTDEDKTSGEYMIKVTSDRYPLVMTLSINGKRAIYDIANSSLLSNSEIRQLGNDVYDLDKYDIRFNNWYALEYGDGKNIYDDDVFEAVPKNDDELESLIIETYLNFARQNKR